MYIASVLIGIGAAVLWAAQAEFLHLQSPTDQIMMRNTGIFWCLFQIRNVSALFFWIKCSAEGLCWYLWSLTIGNLYIYLEWSGKNDVSRAEINRLFTGLSILCAIGGVLFLFLKAPFCQYEAPKHLSKEPEDGYWNYFHKNLEWAFYFRNHSKSKTNPMSRNHRNWLQSVSLLRKTYR